MRKNHSLVLTLALLMGLLLASCNRDNGLAEEAIESQLCKSTADKLCAKWFDCWPIISEEIWLDLDTCETGMKAACDRSEAWSDCDVDNDSLRDCDDAVEGSACGDVPDSCRDMADCCNDNN